MKKLIYLFSLILFFIFFNNYNVSATSGTCILKQLSSTLEIETPFYFYEVEELKLVSGSMTPSFTYSHTYEEVTNRESCESINKTPSYLQGILGNALNSSTRNYYFSSSLITDSKTIFNKATSTFKVPSLFQSGYSITGTYLSLDNLPPIIASNQIDSTIIANVGIKISVNEIKNKITAYDEADGVIEVKIKEDNYTSNYNKLGTYTLVFSATDNSENTSTLSLNIKIIDIVKPQIKGKNQIDSYMSNPLTIEQIKSTLTITDNYDTNLNILNIENDNYSPNKTNEGLFEISFTALDNSNNESLPFTVKVNVIDDIPPIIEGQYSYTVNIKNLLQTSTIIEQLSVKDNVDDNPIVEILNDSYTANYYKVGAYQISLIAKDKNANNSSTFIINIITEDKDKPIFYISQKFISLNPTNQIPIEELIDIISLQNNIDKNNINNIEIIENTYSSNYSSNGNYKIKLDYSLKDTSSIVIETNILVEDLTANSKQNKSTPKKTFWSTIKSFFNKIWNFIKQIIIWFKQLI